MAATGKEIWAGLRPLYGERGSVRDFIINVGLGLEPARYLDPQSEICKNAG